MSAEPHEAAGGVQGALRTLTVTMPLPDRNLCGNGTGRSNGYQRARLVKAAREAARRCAEVQAPLVFAAQDRRAAVLSGLPGAGHGDGTARSAVGGAAGSMTTT